VWIRAIRKIEPGEEITYDYCLYDGGVDEAFCNCGARDCRGTMYSAKEVKRRKSSAGKSAKKKKQTHRRTRATELPIPRPAEVDAEEDAA
jgi:hypothetical protein